MDCNCCKTKPTDIKPMEEKKPKTPIKEDKAEEIKHKKIDPKQEPIPPDRKVNVPNIYNLKEAPKEYSTVRHRICSGDIILFNIKDIVKYIERIITRTKYDHVGMLVLEKDLNEESLRRLNVGKGSLDRIFVIHMVSEGMRMNDINELLGSKKITVSYRHLNVKRTPKMIEGINEFIRQFSHVPYEKNFIEMFKSAYDSIGGTNEEEALDTLFCSEMMARIYQEMGLLLPSKDGGLVCNEYAPRDFTSKIELHLLQDATIEDEVVIVSDLGAEETE